MKQFPSIHIFISCFLLITIVLFSSSGIYAQPPQPPDDPTPCEFCPECEGDENGSILCAECPSLTGGSVLSLTEGNLGDSYDVVTVKSHFGSTLDLRFINNTSMADGYKAAVITTTGIGWTHSYNMYITEFRTHLFLTGGGGRTTKFKIQPDRITYVPVRGDYQQLVKNPDGTLTMTIKNGTKYYFKRFIPNPFPETRPYFLTKITDRNGNVTILTYDGSGLLQEVKDTFGRSITFTYDSNRRISTIKDPLNRTTTLTYDSDGYHLMKITDPMGKSVEYTYNVNYQITTKKNKNGYLLTYGYNSSGRPVAIRDGNGDLIVSLTNDKNWDYDRIKVILYNERYMIPGTTTKTDGNGNQTRYEYNENGYITKTIAPDGSETTYTYDPVTLNIASKTTCNGITSYEYDAKGNRTKVTDARGNVTGFTYEPTYNRNTSLTDPDGDVTAYTYDAFGNLVKKTDPLGVEITFTYDSCGNVLTETDSKGNTTSYQYDMFGNRTKKIDPLSCATNHTYDLIGNRLSKTDANGHTTTYEYDLCDRLIKKTDPKKCTISYTYDGNGNTLTVTHANGTTTYTYDMRDRLTKITDAMGGIVKYTYDGNGNNITETNALGFTTTYEYDSQNRLTRTTDAKAGQTMSVYDCAGNKTSETDASGNITTYEYDSLNRLIKTIDPLGNTTTYAYNDREGVCPACSSSTAGSSLIASITDCNGKVTCYRYDKLDRRVQVIRKVGDTDCGITDAADAVTKYTYDCLGNRLSVTDENGNTTTYAYNARSDLVTECNPEGEYTHYTYDCVGNTTQKTRPNGNIITYVYNEKNQLVAISDSIGTVALYSYDCLGNKITHEDGNNNKYTYEYDALNRLIKVTDPMGEVTTNEYDAEGNITKVTDRERNQTSYVYDELNRCISVIDPMMGVTTYEYDSVGNPIKVIDCNGNATVCEYDPLHRLTKGTFADGTIKTFTHDCVGNVITRKDQNGAITTYTYDNRYRLIKRDYPDDNDDTFTYDKGGRMLTANKLNSAITFSYDAANRITQTTQNGLAIKYTYDVANNKKTIDYPGGKVVRKERDKRDRLMEIRDDMEQSIATYIYDTADRLTERTYSNTTRATWNYNQNDWITQLTLEKSGLHLIDFAYSYNKEGDHLTKESKHDPLHSEKCTYDSLYRLTNFKRGTLDGEDIPSPNKDCTWTFDDMGNWLNGPLPCPQPEGCPIIPDEMNQYTKICGIGRTHDYIGNLTNDGKNIYEYDYENRLSKVTRNSDGTILGEYRYDALGRRVEKAGSGIVTSYVYDKTCVIEERQREAVYATYIHGDGGKNDGVLTRERGGATYYYNTDVVGSIVALTDEAGDIKEYYRYDPFGFPYIYGGPGEDGTWFTGDDVAVVSSIITNTYSFRGGRWDYLTELYYFGQGDYDPITGRFLGADEPGQMGNFLSGIKGCWSDKWEAFKTMGGGVVTEPDGQIIIDQIGDLAIYIKSQKSSGGKISGTIEIIEWNVDEYPAWESGTETINLTGWLDETNRYTHYFYCTWPKPKSDYLDLISDYTWNFHNIEINASETGIFFTVPTDDLGIGDGEVKFIGGRLDTHDPLGGVDGEEILLGEVFFHHTSSSVSFLSLSEIPEGAYSNLVDTDGTILPTEISLTKQRFSLKRYYLLYLIVSSYR